MVEIINKEDVADNILQTYEICFYGEKYLAVETNKCLSNFSLRSTHNDKILRAEVNSEPTEPRWIFLPNQFDYELMTDAEWERGDGEFDFKFNQFIKDTLPVLDEDLYWYILRVK